MNIMISNDLLSALIGYTLDAMEITIDEIGKWPDEISDLKELDRIEEILTAIINSGWSGPSKSVSPDALLRYVGKARENVLADLEN